MNLLKLIYHLIVFNNNFYFNTLKHYQKWQKK
nr:MAG TPA: hypothetical protein [Caudoviricetes sp.]DAR70380.1 MAG TPA: hypothetical protein [Caudoviricetes sp.]